MNKTYVLVGVIVVTILGAGYYAYSQKSIESVETSSIGDGAELNTNPEPDKESSTPTSDDMAAIAPGEYKEYSESNLASTNGTRLLFFHAPWCPQCRQLDESIKASELPNNTTVFKVDYDSNQTLRQKYGVTIQTTVVKIDGNGDKIDSYVAYQAPTFDNVKAALLSD